MPVIIDLPARPVGLIHPLIEITDSPAASGTDGHELMRQFENVYRHWSDRTEYLEATHDDDVSLHHVPFRMAGTIKVRFQRATLMKPRRIHIEDEEG